MKQVEGNSFPQLLAEREKLSQREKSSSRLAASGLPEAGPAIGPEWLRATRSPWVLLHSSSEIMSCVVFRTLGVT